MAHVLMAHPEFTELFERVITADKITRSKPDPECYLLAARELQMEVDVCCVFEDSFSGIEAGRSAGMQVVGLATTNPREKIQDKVDGEMCIRDSPVSDELLIVFLPIDLSGFDYFLFQTLSVFESVINLFVSCGYG